MDSDASGRAEEHAGMPSPRVLLLAPPFLSVPPDGYGGTERVVAALAAELPRLGWRVEVFAAGHPDSPFSRPVGLSQLGADMERAHVAAAMATIRSNPGKFDIVHDHTRTAALEAGIGLLRPMVTTVHNDVDPVRQEAYRHLGPERLVFLSHAQARRYGRASAQVVPNGIVMADWPLGSGPRGEHVVFLGRLSREKGPHHAIDIARALRVPLILAGGRDPGQGAFFEAELMPRLRDQDVVRWVGEVSGRARWQLLAGARALLSPLDWEEPFGLVLLESMACGTPVIVTARGAVPEVVAHREAGWLVREPGDWARGLAWAREIRPERVRAAVARSLSASEMARRYVGCYASLLARDGRKERA